MRAILEVPGKARGATAAAAVASLLWCGAGSAQVAESKGGLSSSLKQALAQDVTREVVWGHFDQGTPPNAHRYYCLVDPKSGKTEPNGVAGTLVKRRDGMTGLDNPAVVPLSCADAQQKGLLVTSGYVVRGPGIPPGGIASAPVAPVAAGAAGAVGGVSGAPTAAVASAPAVPAASQATTVAAATGAAAVVSAEGVTGQASATASAGVATEITALFARFIFAQNSHDRAALAEVLLDSADFIWADSGSEPVFGYREALADFERAWRGSWRLDPQPTALHVGSPAPGVALLVTPMSRTSGAAGHAAVTTPVQLSGVFVRTGAGWRIAALFMAPASPVASGR